MAAVKLLLSQKGLDASACDRDGDTALHSLMRFMNNSNVRTATLIFNEFLKHPLNDNIVGLLDDFGLNILDRFLCNTNVHSYDLDISTAMKHFLALILSTKELVNESGKTLALAGTLCSTSVFEMLINAGANPNDSLGDETTTHCVIARKSLAKCMLLSSMKPNLSVKWMGNAAVELARIYGCNREIINIFVTPKNQPQVSKINLRLLMILNMTVMVSYMIGLNLNHCYHQIFLLDIILSLQRLLK